MNFEKPKVERKVCDTEKEINRDRDTNRQRNRE